jgi:hypothetical protein
MAGIALVYRDVAAFLLESGKVRGFASAPALCRLQLPRVPVNQITERWPAGLHHAAGSQLFDIGFRAISPTFVEKVSHFGCPAMRTSARHLPFLSMMLAIGYSVYQCRITWYVIQRDTGLFGAS